MRGRNGIGSGGSRRGGRGGAFGKVSLRLLSRSGRIRFRISVLLVCWLCGVSGVGLRISVLLL